MMAGARLWIIRTRIRLADREINNVQDYILELQEELRRLLDHQHRLHGERINVETALRVRKQQASCGANLGWNEVAFTPRPPVRAASMRVITGGKTGGGDHA